MFETLRLLLFSLSLVNIPVLGADLLKCDFYFSEKGWGQDIGKAPSNVSGWCKKHDLSKKPFSATFADGSVVPDPYFASYLLGGMTGRVDQSDVSTFRRKLLPTEDKKKKIFNLFQKVKNHYLEKINSLPASASKTRLLHKLKSMRAQISEKDECEGNQVTAAAYTDIGSNTVYICKSGMGLPVESWLPVIAHEIAHLVDPCSIEIYQFDKRRINEIKTAGKKATEQCSSASSPLQSDSGLTLLIDMASKSSGIAPIPENLEPISDMLKCGIVKSSTPLSLEDHPFISESRCAEAYVKSSKEDESAPNSSSVKTVLSQQACVSKARECFADHVGARITDEFLLYHKDQFSSEGLRHIMSTFVDSVCMYGTRDFGKRYPGPANRLAAYMQHPNIQQAMGCKGLDFKPICPESSLNRATLQPRANK